MRTLLLLACTLGCSAPGAPRPKAVHPATATSEIGEVGETGEAARPNRHATDAAWLRALDRLNGTTAPIAPMAAPMARPVDYRR